MPDIKYFRSDRELNRADMLSFLRTTKNFFSILNSDSLVSELQIKASLEHLKKAGHKRVKDNGTLLLMYISGESQISRAIEAVGVGNKTRNIAVVYEDQDDLRDFQRSFHSLEPQPASPIPADLPENDEQVFGKISKVELDLW